MKKTLLISLVIFGTVFAISCKKKKDDDPAPASNKSKTEYLTAHRWVMTAATADKDVDYDGDGSSNKDVYSQMSDCDKGNSFLFSNVNNIKQGTYFESSCDSTKKAAFAWSFNSDDTELTIVGGGVSDTYTIQQLDDNTLRFSYSTTDDNNLSYTETDTYVKK